MAHPPGPKFWLCSARAQARPLSQGTDSSALGKCRKCSGQVPEVLWAGAGSALGRGRQGLKRAVYFSQNSSISSPTGP